MNSDYLKLDPALHPVVSFVIHCTVLGAHTLVLNHMGVIVLSHHANPQMEYTLTQLGGERKISMCLRWWRALQENAALRERMYTMARQGLNPLERIRVTEEPDGTVSFQERPDVNNVSLESVMWDIGQIRTSRQW